MSTVIVSTTLPCIDDDTIQPFQSQRLIIRLLLHPADLAAYRTIRSQPAAMTSSRTGLPDATVEQTEAKLKRLQPPYRDSHVYFGIFLKKFNENGGGAEEGELIGDGGIHKFANTETGWPEFGYKFKKEHWGRGYATEFARVFMEFWWRLPRVERKVEVVLSSVVGSGGDGVSCQSAVKYVQHKVPEQVCAWTKVGNQASQRVLQKAGFESFDGLENGMLNWRVTSPSKR